MKLPASRFTGCAQYGSVVTMTISITKRTITLKKPGGLPETRAR
jgi:hypothetical protein